MRHQLFLYSGHFPELFHGLQEEEKQFYCSTSRINCSVIIKIHNLCFQQLHVSSHYSRNYFKGLFWPDMMSSLPLVAINQLMLLQIKSNNVHTFKLIFFHCAFVMNLMRIWSLQRCWRYFQDLADVSLEISRP